MSLPISIRPQSSSSSTTSSISSTPSTPSTPLFNCLFENALADKENYPDAIDQSKASYIEKNLNAESRKITIDTVDRMYKIALTIESEIVRDFQLTAICKSYLKLESSEACQRAYIVIKFKDNNSKGLRVQYLLDITVRACLRVNNPDAFKIAQDIFNTYTGKDHAYLEILSGRKARTLSDILNKKIDNRQFSEALSFAKSKECRELKDDLLDELFIRCCTMGDDIALEFALDFSLFETDESVKYLTKLIEVCKACKKSDLLRRCNSELHSLDQDFWLKA